MCVCVGERERERERERVQKVRKFFFKSTLNNSGSHEWRMGGDRRGEGITLTRSYGRREVGAEGREGDKGSHEGEGLSRSRCVGVQLDAKIKKEKILLFFFFF